MFNNFTSSIRRCFQQRKESVSVYRYLDNKKITESYLTENIYNSCQQNCTDKEILVLCDTTEFNIDNHKGRIKNFEGIGATTHNSTLGFFAHAALAVETSSNIKLGWAHINLFNRPIDNKPFVRSNSSVAIEDKESFKWQKACLESIESVVDTASKVTYVMDREADIYELMERVSPMSDFIIRARHNRRIIDQQNNQVYLIDDIKQKPYNNLVKVYVNGESRNQKKRDAICELTYAEYEIPITSKVLHKDKYKKSIKLNVVHIEEKQERDNKNISPLSWTLITNKQIETKEEAMAIIDNYKRRWDIEESFRLLKTQGFDIETSQLESGNRIRKWLLLGMEVSIKIMKLKTSRQGDTDLKTVELFDKQEIECLKLLNRKLQGNTEKLKNPYSNINLAWAAWLIARLGGWDGYQSQRPPGTITFKRGLDAFYQKAEMYKLIKNSS